MLYAIGTSPYDLVKIENRIFECFEDNFMKSEFKNFINIKYDIIQSKCTIFNNRFDAIDALKEIRNENNVITFENGNLLYKIGESYKKEEPKVEDLKIYRLYVEEV